MSRSSMPQQFSEIRYRSRSPIQIILKGKSVLSSIGNMLGAQASGCGSYYKRGQDPANQRATRHSERKGNVWRNQPNLMFPQKTTRCGRSTTSRMVFGAST